MSYIYLQLDDTNKAIGWQISPEELNDPYLMLVDDISIAADALGKQLIDGEWVEIARAFDGTVSISRFLKDLLTLPVYGAMEVAETGLSAKFSAGTATQQDIQLLGLFRAAKAWLTSAQSLNLQDTLVAQILDACIAIPQIGLSIADKERILRNEAKA